MTPRTIHANMVIDDTDALRAAIRNEPVFLRGRLYQPHENIVIQEPMLLLSEIHALVEHDPPAEGENKICEWAPLFSRRNIYVCDEQKNVENVPTYEPWAHPSVFKSTAEMNLRQRRWRDARWR